MKKEKTYVLYDSDICGYVDTCYEDYLDWCECLGKKVESKDSQEYWDYCGKRCRDDYEQLIYELADDYRFSSIICVVTGDAGLWNGRFSYVPTICESICDAVCKCCEDKDRVKVTWENGVMKVYGYHHDGCNEYEIRYLSAKGENRFKRNRYNYNFIDFNPKYDFKKVPYLFAI